MVLTNESWIQTHAKDATLHTLLQRLRQPNLTLAPIIIPGNEAWKCKNNRTAFIQQSDNTHTQNHPQKIYIWTNSF